MTRKEKVQALQAIKAGTMTPGMLNPEKVFIFYQMSANPATYECEGKTLNDAEFKAKCKAIREAKQRLIVWNEEKDYGTGKKPLLLVHTAPGDGQITVIALPDNGRDKI